MKKVFVTGASGFIGSNLICYLANKGMEVYALVENESMIHELKNVHYIVGDLNDIGSIVDQLPAKRIDTVYHLAWKGVRADLKNNMEIQVENMDYFFNMLEIIKKLNIYKLIIPESISQFAYAKGEVSACTPPSPADTYAAVKIAIHYIADAFAQNENIELIHAVLPSIYGPGRDDNNLISYTIKSLLKEEVPQFTKLEQTWEYLYIDDLIEALYLLGEKGKNKKTYFIGSNERKKLKDYVEIIKEKLNPSGQLNIGTLPYKNNKIDNSILDSTEFVRDTGFNAKVSFDVGIQNTISFFKKFLEETNTNN